MDWLAVPPYEGQLGEHGNPFNFSEWRAVQLLTAHAALWQDYGIELDSEGNAFLKGLDRRYCYPDYGSE